MNLLKNKKKKTTKHNMKKTAEMLCRLGTYNTITLSRALNFKSQTGKCESIISCNHSSLHVKLFWRLKSTAKVLATKINTAKCREIHINNMARDLAIQWQLCYVSLPETHYITPYILNIVWITKKIKCANH